MHVQPAETVPSYRHALRQDRTLIRRLPMPRSRKALATILCQQGLIQWQLIDETDPPSVLASKFGIHIENVRLEQQTDEQD
jgi:hypothetical protein